MNDKLTEMVFILDRSGSMSGKEADTIGGFNWQAFTRSYSTTSQYPPFVRPTLFSLPMDFSSAIIADTLDCPKPDNLHKSAIFAVGLLHFYSTFLVLLFHFYSTFPFLLFHFYSTFPSDYYTTPQPDAAGRSLKTPR